MTFGPRPSRRTAAAIFAVMASLLPSVDVVAPLLDLWDADDSAEEVSGLDPRDPVEATSRSLQRPHARLVPEDAGSSSGDAIAVLWIPAPDSRPSAWVPVDSCRSLPPRSRPLCGADFERGPPPAL